MSVQIIADSTCDLEPSLIEGSDLKVLPLSILIGEQSYVDGEDIQFSELADVMRRGIVPKTAQISYERTHSLFRSCLESGKDVIYASFSSALSGCYMLARMIAEELRAEFPERKIAVLDSKGGSGATGIIMLRIFV